MPWPGKKGEAEYCGFGAHVYRMGALWEDGKLRCIDCSHVKGERRKKATP